MKCHSLESCSLVKITPPPLYTPITVTVLKRKYSLSSIEMSILLTDCHTFLLNACSEKLVINQDIMHQSIPVVPMISRLTLLLHVPAMPEYD